MISSFVIEKIIQKLIDAEITKFIIYPYGMNGKNVRKILENKFEISPLFIVDNALSQCDSSIINVAELEQEYKEDCYILLTAENAELNQKLFEQIGKFADKKHIINLIDYKNQIYADAFPDFGAFRLNRILGTNSEKFTLWNKDEHIKIRILNFSQATWNAIHTICKACKEDAQIDLLIIMGQKNLSDDMLDEIRAEKFNYIKIDNYDITTDLPDILVVNHPYDIFSNIKDCRRYCKLIVAASMQLVRYAHDWDSFFYQQRKGFGRFYPDYYLFDSLLYHDIVNAGYGSERVVEMGNAKFDGIFQGVHKKEFPKEWEKLKGKKVFLWTTDHGVHDGMITQDVTLDLYGRYLFEYAEQHPDICLIFRPHKTLISELLTAGLWNMEDVNSLKKYCEQSNNVIFDDSLTYDMAYSVADAIITDAYCGITCSALPLLKPMLLLYRSHEDTPYHKEIAECSYSAASCREIGDFIELVISGKDTKYQLRKENAAKCVKNFDGKNGWRIKEFLKQKYWTMNR